MGTLQVSTAFISVLMLLTTSIAVPAENLCHHFSTSLNCDCDMDSIQCFGVQSNSSEMQEILLSIPTVSHVLLEVHNLSFTTDFRFQNLSIKNLTLGYGLETPPVNFFSDLGSSLVYLNLNNNSITYINDKLFSSLSSLKSLHIDSNELTEVKPSVFASLINLEHLSIASNGVNEIEEESFSNLTLLHSLVLSHNNLSDFKNVNIRSSSLSELKLDDCFIGGSLSKDTFSGLPNLEQLDLAHNLISEVKPHSLASMHVLQFLNLSHNEIVFLQENSFFELGNLTVLDLKANKIYLVKRSSFTGLLNLKLLDLSQNRLKAFLCDYAADFASLETINLQDNEIKVFTAGAFYYSPLLKELILDGNNLECSCDLTAMAYHLIENSTMERKDWDSVHCVITSTLGYIPIIDYKNSKCIPGEPCRKSHSFAAEEDDYYDYDYTDPSLVSSTTVLTDSSIGTTLSTKKDSTANSSIDSVTTLTVDDPSFETTPNISETSTFLASSSHSSFSYEETTPMHELSTDSELFSKSDSSSVELSSSNQTASFLPTDVFRSHNSTDSTTVIEEKLGHETTPRDFTTSTIDVKDESSTTDSHVKHESSTELTTLSDSTIETVSGSELTSPGSVESPIRTTSRESDAQSPSESTTELFSTTLLSSTGPKSTPPVTSLVIKSTCDDVKLSFNISALGIDAGIIKNFTYDGYTFCLKWTLSTPLPSKTRCIIKYTFIKGVKSENLICPEFPGDVKLWSKNENIYKFCLKVYGASIGGSCENLTEKKLPANTTFTVSTTQVPNTTTFNPTTPKIKTDPKSTFRTSSTRSFAAATTPRTHSTTSTTVSTIATNKPYISSLEIYFNDSSFAYAKWVVKEKFSKNICNLTLTATTQYFEHNEGTFPCKSHTHKLQNVQEDEIFKLCLAVHHKLDDYNVICKYSLDKASVEGEASSRENNSSNSSSSLIPLVCLLILLLLVVVFIVYKNVFKKRQESERYDVRAEEEKSQRVEFRTSSHNNSLYRSSYIAKDNADI